MLVTCKSVDDFLANLEQADNLFEDAVRIDVTRRQLDEVRYAVVFQASCVVQTDDGGEYILQVGEECGVDYEDTTQDFGGTDSAADVRHRVTDFCKSRQFKVLPGTIGF
jgi:hypothetical protein